MSWKLGAIVAILMTTLVAGPRAQAGSIEFSLEIRQTIANNIVEFIAWPRVNYTFDPDLETDTVIRVGNATDDFSGYHNGSYYAVSTVFYDFDQFKASFAGDWSLIFNPDTAEATTFTFTVDASALTLDTLPPVRILSPLFGSIIDGSATVVEYQGPADIQPLIYGWANWDPAHYYLPGAGYLPANSTSFAVPAPLEDSAIYELYVQYSLGQAADIPVSTPVDQNLTPIDDATYGHEWLPSDFRSTAGRTIFYTSGIPEPSSLALLTVFLASCASVRRR